MSASSHGPDSRFDVEIETAQLRRLRLLYDGITVMPDLTADGRIDTDRHTLQKMVQIESQLISEGRWAAGPATLFAVLRLQHHEIANCRVLGWLLDPLAHHGLGATALRSLLRSLDSLVEEPHFPSLVGLERTTIVLEEARGRTRADVVLYGPNWTVVIEAKTDAAEQPEQGQRLAANWPDAVYVFLTKRGRPMSTAGDSNWLPLTWTAVFDLVRDALRDADPPFTAAAGTARAAVRDYLIAAGQMEHTDR